MIDAILATQDLRQIAERDGADFTKDLRGWRSACPIHHSENDSVFVMWDAGDKLRWKCWSGPCGGGDVIDYVMAHDRVDLKRAIEILGGKSSITPEEVQAAAVERRKQAETYEITKRQEYEQALSELRQARAWETYYDNLCFSEEAQRLWKERGVPGDFQSYWQLGYCPDFCYSSKHQLYHSPSLTIPIFDGGDEPSNIRHRLLNPVNPKDKYRPERPGLKSLPFMAAYEKSDLDHVLVVEGEVKAMVTYITLDSETWQVYGIPGKENFRGLMDQLKGRKVWIAFDPDAGSEAEEAARIVNGRIIQLAMKIDDAINAEYLSKNNLRFLIKNARRVL